MYPFAPSWNPNMLNFVLLKKIEPLINTDMENNEKFG